MKKSLNLQNQQKQQTKLKFLESKYGMFQGYMNDYSKQGDGVFISDDGLIYLGQFLKDQMSGLGILLFPYGGMALGYFQKNKIHGSCLLRYPESNNLLLGEFDCSKLIGMAYIFEHNNMNWQLWKCQNGEPKEIICEENVVNLQDIPVIMKKNKSARDLVKKYFKQRIFERIAKDQMGLINVKFDGKLSYYGFGVNKQPQGLGVVYSEQNIIFSGSFKDGILEGLGRIQLDNGDIYDGNFEKGQFNNEGIYYNKENNNYIYGQFKNNICINQFKGGNNYPFKLIINRRMNQHQKSIEYFDNNFKLQHLDLQKETFEMFFISKQETMDSIITENQQNEQNQDKINQSQNYKCDLQNQSQQSIALKDFEESYQRIKEKKFNLIEQDVKVKPKIQQDAYFSFQNSPISPKKFYTSPIKKEDLKSVPQSFEQSNQSLIKLQKFNQDNSIQKEEQISQSQFNIETPIKNNAYNQKHTKIINSNNRVGHIKKLSQQSVEFSSQNQSIDKGYAQETNQNSENISSDNSLLVFQNLTNTKKLHVINPKIQKENETKNLSLPFNQYSTLDKANQFERKCTVLKIENSDKSVQKRRNIFGPVQLNQQNIY